MASIVTPVELLSRGESKVTLRVPADKLRDVNLAIENGVWGAYRTEFYPTYDYRPVWEAEQKSRNP